MCLPICISWDRDFLPVASGNRLVLPLLPTGGLGFPEEPVGGELVPEHTILVDFEPVPPLVLAGDRLDLLPVPSVDVQLLGFVVAGRIRGLLLA